jgi:hypothetical protein
VKPGEENWATALLYDWFGAFLLPWPPQTIRLPDTQLLIGPNYVMTISASGRLTHAIRTQFLVGQQVL